MATLSFSCPKCQRGFDKVKAEMAGSKVKCQCGHVFRLGPKKSKPSSGPPKQATKRTPVTRSRPQPPRSVPTSEAAAETKPTAPLSAEPSSPPKPPKPARPSAETTLRDAEVEELISFATEPTANSAADSDSFDGLDDSAELDQLLAQPSHSAQPSLATQTRLAGADSADDLMPVASAPPTSRTPSRPKGKPAPKRAGSGIDLNKNIPLASEDDLELLDDDLELLDDDLEILDDSSWSQAPPFGTSTGSVYPQAPSAAPLPSSTSPYGVPAPGGPVHPQPYPGGMAQAAPNPYGNPYAPVGPPLQSGYSGTQRFPTWVITAPGIAMIVCGSLDLLWVLFIVARTIATGMGLAMMPETEFGPPMAEGVKEFVITTTIFSAAISLILLAIALTVLMGGINMVKRTGYGRAMAGAICAILPCAIMDLAVVEIGIGIWALVVLCMEGYRRQFD